MPHSPVNCSVPDCGNGARHRGLCNMHYRRLLRFGDPGEAASRLHTGDDAGYQAVHRRLLKQRGRAAEQTCRCGLSAQQWAYLPGGDDPRRRVSPEGLVYSPDLSTYQALCRSCHMLEDGGAPGERNGQAKLTENDVREIRRLYAAGWGSHSALAREFGVGQPTVTMIIGRRTWKHVL